MQQDPDSVLIRDPGNRFYNEPAGKVSDTAKEQWEYAVLSENVYVGSWDKLRTAVPVLPEPKPEEYVSSCEDRNRTRRIPLAGWKLWKNFPSEKLIAKAEDLGLYFEVWENESFPRVVAVVFRGTDGWADWFANLRWLLWLLRFIPYYEDQYHVVSRDVGEEFTKRFLQDHGNITNPAAPKVQVLATGHSLGGGLAQHFAYSLPRETRVPRVSRVYAFDPSPVTGWSSVNTELRTANAQGLETDRIFEHGEILAYVRLLLSYVYPPPAKNPSVREIRYNFDKSINPFKSHSMRLLACELVKASGQVPLR